MKNSDYAYSVAYIRAIEQKLLTKADIDSLAAAKSADEVFAFLASKSYDSSVSETNYNKLLTEFFEAAYDEAFSAAPKDSPLELMICKNDFHNLKAAIKGAMLDIKNWDDYMLTPCRYDYTLFTEAVKKADFDSLPEELSTVAKKAYETLGLTSDGQLVDMMTDKAAMKYCAKKARESGCEFLLGLVRLENTLADIKIAVRCAHTGKSENFVSDALSGESYLDAKELVTACSEGVEAIYELLVRHNMSDAADALEKSMSEYEKYAESAVSQYMKGSAYITLGPEPLYSFIHAAQNEVKALRLIITAKLSGMDFEELEARLEGLY